MRQRHRVAPPANALVAGRAEAHRRRESQPPGGRDVAWVHRRPLACVSVGALHRDEEPGHAVAPGRVRPQPGCPRRPSVGLSACGALDRQARRRPGGLLPRPGGRAGQSGGQRGERRRGLLRRRPRGARLLARRRCPAAGGRRRCRSRRADARPRRRASGDRSRDRRRPCAAGAGVRRDVLGAEERERAVRARRRAAAAGDPVRARGGGRGGARLHGARRGARAARARWGGVDRGRGLRRRGVSGIGRRAPAIRSCIRTCWSRTSSKGTTGAGRRWTGAGSTSTRRRRATCTRRRCGSG